MNRETYKNKTIVLAVLFALFSPVLVSAQITSETSAESDTGGNRGSGTSGNASASSHSTTVIDGNGRGTVEVKVRTETNGVVQEETIKKEVQGTTEVRVSTTSKSAAQQKAEVKTKVEAKTEAGREDSAVQGLSHVASTTFSLWRTIPSWFSFGLKSTTTVKTNIEDDGRVLGMIGRPHGTTTPGIGIRGFFAKMFDIVIFWR